MSSTIDQSNKIALTQYSKGAGCGCKIAPSVLSEILAQHSVGISTPKLLVGNDTKDDAAVYQIDEQNALISTTDFFLPIVDDPFQFGQIAAANAISDVYAMGGNPLFALAVLGWPIDTIPVSAAQEVMAGARAVCAEAGIVMAGGHSIDSKDPIFGLVVNGMVAIENLKRNNSAKAGDILLLTKPLGVGILATAQKEFTQIFPKPGWVEHEPEDIWQGAITTLRQALEKAGVTVHRIVPELPLTEGPLKLTALGDADTGWLWMNHPERGIWGQPLHGLHPQSLTLGFSADELILADIQAEPSLVAKTSELLGQTAQLMTPGQHWQSAIASDWDLAQFDLRANNRTRQFKTWQRGANTLWHSPAWRRMVACTCLTCCPRRATCMPVRAWPTPRPRCWRRSSPAMPSRAAIRSVAKFHRNPK